MSQSCFHIISSWKSIIVIFLWRYSEKTYPEVSCWRGRSCDKFDAFILSQLLSFHNFISDLSLTIVIVLFGQDTVPVGRSDRKKDHHHYITKSITSSSRIFPLSQTSFPPREYNLNHLKHPSEILGTVKDISLLKPCIFQGCLWNASLWQISSIWGVATVLDVSQ